MNLFEKVDQVIRKYVQVRYPDMAWKGCRYYATWLSILRYMAVDTTLNSYIFYKLSFAIDSGSYRLKIVKKNSKFCWK